ncbi:MAG: tetratricopeptide repeat protein [Proteiniphilum sp.]|nr:tetratricopeptide repeat protein [Proteiniphilum sp.]
MTKEKLYSCIEDPHLLDETTLQELERVVAAYPCFQASRLLYTKNLDLVDSDQYGEELGKTAVLCCDRRQLLYLIRHEQYERFLSSASDSRTTGPADRTEALLDSFLSTLPDNREKKTTIQEADLHIAGSDYFAYLESLGEQQDREGAESQPLQHQDIIDAFIEKAASNDLFISGEPQPRENTQEPDPEEKGGEFLTETLARIYIKQQKYEQALTIIKRLSLNFPKKSVYFADQIRFLEYLMINEKNKNK